MRRVLLILLMSVTIVTSSAALVYAFTTSEKIIVANQIVAIARVPAGGFSADQRIDKVNDRLAFILGNERLDAGSIRVVKQRGENAIVVGNRLLFTVTAADAKANHTTVNGLTRVWLKAARTAIPQARPRANLPG